MIRDLAPQWVDPMPERLEPGDVMGHRDAPNRV